MRNYILLFILVLFSSPLAGQNYYVVSIKGIVLADGQEINKKDKIKESANLTFTSKQDHVYVVAPGKGYFILSAIKIPAKSQNEFLLSLKEALIPPNEFHATSTRPVLTADEQIAFDDIYDMKAYFKESILVIDQLTMEVNEKEFPLNEYTCFQLKYELPYGQFSTCLPNTDNRIELNHQILRITDKISLSQNDIGKAELSYLDRAKNTITNIGNFDLTILDKSTLTDELKMLRKALPGIDSENFLFAHALPFVEKTYGKVDKAQLKELVQGVFK